MISRERILMKKPLVKKSIYRIVDYNADFKRFMKCSYNLHNSYNEVNF